MNDNSPTFNTSTFKASVPENTNSTVSSRKYHGQEENIKMTCDKNKFTAPLFINNGLLYYFTIKCMSFDILKHVIII